MPVTYTFSADRRTIHTRCAGFVTVEEVVEHFQTLARDPLCPVRVDVFLDLSELDAASIPQSLHLPRVVLELKRIKDRVRFGACAVVAPQDAVFGMMRVFEALAEEHFQAMRVFREPRGGGSLA